MRHAKSSQPTPSKSFPARKKQKREDEPALSQAALEQDIEMSVINPNGSTMDSAVQPALPTPQEKQAAALKRMEMLEISCDLSEESSTEEGPPLTEEEFICLFRTECQAWLLDHGKAFFHVEALAFFREAEKKKTKTAGSQYGFSSRKL